MLYFVGGLINGLGDRFYERFSYVPANKPEEWTHSFLLFCNRLVNLINRYKNRGGDLGVPTLLTQSRVPKFEEDL